MVLGSESSKPFSAASARSALAASGVTAEQLNAMNLTGSLWTSGSLRGTPAVVSDAGQPAQLPDKALDMPARAAVDLGRLLTRDQREVVAFSGPQIVCAGL